MASACVCNTKSTETPTALAISCGFHSVGATLTVIDSIVLLTVLLPPPLEVGNRTGVIGVNVIPPSGFPIGGSVGMGSGGKAGTPPDGAAMERIVSASRLIT